MVIDLSNFVKPKVFRVVKLCFCWPNYKLRQLKTEKKFYINIERKQFRSLQ